MCIIGYRVTIGTSPKKTADVQKFVESNLQGKREL